MKKNKIKKFNIAIIGCTFLTYHFLKSLLHEKYNVKLLITKKNEGYNSDYINLKKIFKRKLNTIETKNINSKIIEKILISNEINLIFVIGWSHMLKKNILKIPKYGSIGHHPTKLPQNRGKHPIIWSIFLGLRNIGSSFFILTEKIDAGKILCQKVYKIKENMDSYNLLKKISKGFPKQIKILFHNLERKKFIENKFIKSNYWRKRGFKDGILDFRMHAKSIYKLILALRDPYPNAVVIFKNKNFFINKAKLVKEKNKNFFMGQIIKRGKDYVTIKCYKDAIKLYNKALANILIKVNYL